ncbi:DUF3850 domain-containing protein [Yersinia ruckeri]|nr:DUF3850 domain-containing protein [Yersinia ruckeri]
MTNTKTIDSIKGITCVINAIQSFPHELHPLLSAMAKHAIGHLTSAASEIECLSCIESSQKQKIKQLNKRVGYLEYFHSAFEPLWDSLIFAIAGTDAGKNIVTAGLFSTTTNALKAINKTESGRKEAMRTATAFQEAVTAYTYAPRTHELKILPEYFHAVIEGKKKAELRIDDRGFRVGDYLLLKEWDGGADEFTGREIKVLTTDITEADFAIQGLVMLSFALIDNLSSCNANAAILSGNK